MRAIVLLLVLLAAIRPAVAQQAPPPDSAALAEATKLLDRVDLVALTRQQLDAAIKAQRAMLESAFVSQGRADILAEVNRFAMQQFERRLPQFIDEAASVYARVFTLDELRELNAFYDTPLGKKTLASLPEVLQELTVVSQRLGVEIFQAIMTDLLPEMRRRQAPSTPK